MNGKSQTNRYQKSNLLLLQRHNLKKFKSNFLKIDKKHYKGIDTLQLKIGDCGNIHSAIPCFCLLIMQVDILKKNMEIKT